MKISNKAKDIMLLTGILFVIFFAIVAFFVAVIDCFAETERQIAEYQSRPTIIRAETEEDRKWDRTWRKQYRDYYGVEYAEGEE